MSPKKLGYIDSGDIVAVVKIEAGGTKGDGCGESDKKFLGMIGKVESNNGFGMCHVKFPDGSSGKFWNTASLEYATKEQIKKYEGDIKKYSKRP